MWQKSIWCHVFISGTFRQDERPNSDLRSHHCDALHRHGAKIQRLNYKWAAFKQTTECDHKNFRSTSGSGDRFPHQNCDCWSILISIQCLEKGTWDKIIYEILWKLFLMVQIIEDFYMSINQINLIECKKDEWIEGKKKIRYIKAAEKNICKSRNSDITIFIHYYH